MPANRTEKHNYLLLVFAVYALTLFVYKDFRIPNMAGYALLGMALLLTVVSSRSLMIKGDLTVPFVFLALFCTLEITISYTIDGITSFVMYVPAFALCVMIIALSRPDNKQLDNVIRIWIVLALLYSLLMIAIKVMPAIYYSILRRFMSYDSRSMNDFAISNGYGFMLGANAVLADYIIAFPFLILINKLLRSSKLFVKENLMTICILGIFFLAVFVANRKSELLTLFIVCVILAFSRTNSIEKSQQQKNIVRVLVLVLLMFFAVAFLYNAGLLGRYGAFIDRLLFNTSNSMNKLDISSGRTRLWGIAWNLFRENPILGIGWGGFAQFVPTTLQSGHVDIFTVKNVHNCYLQLLCETGIVGFIVFVVLVGYILFVMIRRQKRLNKDASLKKYQMINSACIGYQLFFLIVSAIDPCIYKLIFWIFYSISIIISDACVSESVIGAFKKKQVSVR